MVIFHCYVSLPKGNIYIYMMGIYVYKIYIYIHPNHRRWKSHEEKSGGGNKVNDLSWDIAFMKKYKWGSNKPYIYILYNIYIYTVFQYSPFIWNRFETSSPKVLTCPVSPISVEHFYDFYDYDSLDMADLARTWRNFFLLIPKIEQDLWFTGFNKSWPVPIIYSYKYIQYIYIYSLVSVIHEPAWTHHGLSWSEHGILPNLVVFHTLSLWKCPWLWVFP